MADPGPERRDIATVLADLRVSVAKIEQTQLNQAEILRRLENKLDLGVFREEYERRNAELTSKVDAVTRDYEQRKGRDQVLRVGFAVALALIGSTTGALALHVIH